MKLFIPGPEAAAQHINALVNTARAGTNGLADPQQAILKAVQKLILRTELDFDADRMDLDLLQKHATSSEEARQLVRLMVIVSLADGPPSTNQLSLIEQVASALRVKEPAVKVIRPLVENKLRRFRIAFMRRSHIRNYFANTYRIGGGVGAVVKGVLVFRGVMTDPSAAERFQALRELSEDTLGRKFHDHCIDAGITFPGQKGGFPIGAVYHDFTHVLSDYDTSPEGEMKAAAFQAGYTRGNWDFFTMLFGLLIHTAAINLAPFEMPKLPGRIAQLNLAVETFHALQRGSAINQDLGDWNFWEYVDQPIDDVRQALDIAPVDTSLLAA